MAHLHASGQSRGVSEGEVSEATGFVKLTLEVMTFVTDCYGCRQLDILVFIPEKGLWCRLSMDTFRLNKLSSDEYSSFVTYSSLPEYHLPCRTKQQQQRTCCRRPINDLYLHRPNSMCVCLHL
jgi:hypothetical protein